MASQSSQKRSPRSSAKSEKEKSIMPDTTHRTYEVTEEEQHIDRSFDHVARVREAKGAAQREIEEFGDVSEYDITVIQGQLKEEIAGASQPELDFDDEIRKED